MTCVSIVKFHWQFVLICQFTVELTRTPNRM